MPLSFRAESLSSFEMGSSGFCCCTTKLPVTSSSPKSPCMPFLMALCISVGCLDRFSRLVPMFKFSIECSLIFSLIFFLINQSSFSPHNYSSVKLISLVNSFRGSDHTNTIWKKMQALSISLIYYTKFRYAYCLFFSIQQACILYPRSSRIEQSSS
jgi:hypothetical protein